MIRENLSMAMEEFVEGIVRPQQWVAPIHWRTCRVCRTVALSVCYVALYLTLDRLSFTNALHGIGITPWNPSTGLSVALLITKGLRYAPLVMAAELLSGTILPSEPITLLSVSLGSLIVTGGYMGAAAMLRHAGLQAGIRISSDVVGLLIVAVISSGLVASGFVAIYAAAGVVPWSSFARAGFYFWIGDAIGIVVLVPPLLVMYERGKQLIPWHHGWVSFQFIEFAAQGASIVGALAAVFAGLAGDHPLELFYLLFLPLIWIATRHGLPAAGWALLAIQIGLIAGIEIQDYSEFTLRSFQLFMFALAATGLILGAVVSDRRRLALALVESEGRRTAILNTARDGVLTIDAHGYIQSINPAVERLFLRSSQQLIGLNVCELVEGAPDLLHRLKLAADSPASEAACWELDAQRADGHIFPIEFSAGRVDLQGEQHYTVIMRDITSRRKAEARYRKHEAELAHVSRVSLAGEMATGLAHELSQPLTAIAAYARGCLQLLAGSAPEPSLLHEGIAQVVQQAQRAGNVLDRLREFVLGGEYQRALIEISPLIDAATSLMRTEAMQQEVEIEERIDPDLPVVLADRIQIEQVLLNLLRNAMDAIEAANPERRLIVIEAHRKGDHAVGISVADSGPGVAAEERDRIFEPFVTTKPLGMGMGLSISRTIVESHGGNLGMARGTHSGAIFIFDLPTAEAEESADAR